MKQFNLEEYLKNPSKKVVTRGGLPVKIYCTNFVTLHKPVIAEIAGRGYSQSFTKEGRFYEDTYESSEDLFFASEKHEGWLNLYRSALDVIYAGCVYTSEKEAKEHIDDTQRYVTTVKIEWEE